MSGFVLLSLDMSYRVHLSKVSLNRTGQDVSILQSAPGLVSKGKGQLIRRKGEQMSEFAHQIGFRQSLGRNREDALTACWLPQKAALGGIEVQFEHLVAKARAQVVVIAPNVEPPVGPYAPKPATVRQVPKDTSKVEHLRFPFRTIEATRVRRLWIGL